MFRLLLMLAVALAVASQATLLPRAHAETGRRPALHWSRSAEAQSCIDPQALALRVTALTGPVLVAASEADISIEGHITRSADGAFTARITATGRGSVPRGERNLSHRGDCRGIDQALAFVIALLIDPDLVLQELPASLVALGAEGPAPEATLLDELRQKPPQPVVLEAAARPASPAARDAPKTAAAQHVLRYELTAGPLFALKELPRAGLGLLLSFALVPRAWLAVQLGLRGLAMVGEHALDPVRSFRAQTYGGYALVCPRYAYRELTVDFCAGPDVALIRASGAGFSQNGAGSVMAVGGLLSSGIAVRVRGEWSLHLRGHARFLFNKPRFRYAQTDGDHYAYPVARSAGGVSLSLGYRF